MVKKSCENLIICAGNGENFSFATPVGVGLVNAAINLSNILSHTMPRNIVFVGTCGLYKNGKLLEIYESNQAFNIEISAILGLSYSPIFQNFSQNYSAVSYETKLTNSSNFITTDKNIAHKFSDLGLFMENMEFYSICEVAKFYKIAVRGIFCATNFCDKNAHENFVKNHKKAKEILEKYLIESI